MSATGNSQADLDAPMIVESAAIVTPRVKRTASAIESSANSNSSLDVSGKKTKAEPSADDQKSRGLRHFSLRVCKKVEQKQRTTYNEVADELVVELMNVRETDDSDADAQSKDSVRGISSKKVNSSIDEKNIRRRVYDALNVLMAMNIISKDKKEIRWIGFPMHSDDDVEELQRERTTLIKKIETKRESLYELLIQNICFRNLCARNRSLESGAESSTPIDENCKIPLPFIVVQTSPKAQVNCDINEDRTSAVFDFDMPFQIHDDNEILKRSGLYKTTLEELSSFLPKDMVQYFIDNGFLENIVPPSETYPGYIRSGPHFAPYIQQGEPRYAPQDVMNTSDSTVVPSRDSSV